MSTPHFFLSQLNAIHMPFTVETIFWSQLKEEKKTLFIRMKKLYLFKHKDFPLKIIFDSETGSLSIYPGALDNDYL